MPHLFYGRTVPGTLIIGSWLVLIAYSFVSAFFAKPSVRGQRRQFGAAFGVELAIAAFALFQLLWARTNLRWQADFASFWSWIGAALTLAGMSIAVLARVYLGRNFGQPQTLRKDHEPRLAGQQSEYLERQLRAFADWRRWNPVMFNVARVLNPSMQSELAAHFKDPNPKPLAGAPRELMAMGETIYEEGISDAGIAPCSSRGTDRLQESNFARSNPDLSRQIDTNGKTCNRHRRGLQTP
jgi:hypothetical protein